MREPGGRAGQQHSSFAFGTIAPMAKSRGKDAGKDSLDEILRHLKELRTAGKETVRKMNELEKKIAALREQQKRDTSAHEKGRG